MFTRSSAPRSIGGVLDDTFRLYRLGFRKVWPVALLAQASISLPLVWLRVDMFGSATQPAALDTSRLLAHWPVLAVGYIALVIGSLIFQNAMLAQYLAQASNTALSIGGSVSVSLRFFMRALGIVLVLVLGTMLIGVLVAILAGVLGGFARGLLVACLGVACLIVVIRIFLSNCVLVAEDSAVFEAIGGSWTLTRGHWWRVTGILTVLSILVLVILFIVGFLVGLIAIALHSAGTAGFALTEVVSIVGNSLYTPLVSACVLAIYFDLKLRRDGSDLAGRVDALAAG
jgi:hypothetical protein